jgi:uncharacterized protein YndB with AHSA1/START domain
MERHERGGNDMGRSLIHAVHAEADPGTVYEAITTSKGLASFWTPDSQADPVVGSTARFGFEAAPVPIEFRIDDLDHERRAAWTCLGPWPYWEATTVAWELSPGPEGKGTHVLFRHDGWADDYADAEFGSVNFTWGMVIGALKAYTETGEPKPALR